MAGRRRLVAARPLVFGSTPVPAAARPVVATPRPREWASFPGGRVGWSWESRDWLAVPDDGRPPREFTGRPDAVAYLEGK